MKSKTTLLLAFLVSLFSYAQQSYTIEGTTYSLHTEVEGTLTLLWNTIDGNYRFFAKKGDEITELTNSKQDGRYLEEYKQVLASWTADQAMDTQKLSLTIPSLKDFFNDYNSRVDTEYVVEDNRVGLESRLGVFVGMSNNTASYNPDNIFSPYAGLGYELTGEGMYRRHGITLDFRYSFAADGYDLTYGQFGLGYRFKFIHQEKFAVFAQVRLTTFTFSKLKEANSQGLENLSSSSLQAPVGLGLGAEYQLGNGYLSLIINDLYSPGLDTNDEFPINVSVGYAWAW
jgi:hypothetical protein